MLKQIMKFMRDEEGATAIEYGLIVGLVAVVIAAILTITGTDLSALFTSVNTRLTNAAG